jgi:hypothetical protein
MGKYTKIKEGQRICVDLEDQTNSVLYYPKYIFSMLVESGFSYRIGSTSTGIEFVHNNDIRLTVVISLDHNHNWHHLISYRHSKWTLTYEGDVKLHVFGDDVLKTIRRAYLHWYGL